MTAPTTGPACECLATAWWCTCGAHPTTRTGPIETTDPCPRTSPHPAHIWTYSTNPPENHICRGH